MKKVFLACTSVLLSACTISFQNISTHGTATDLVDENQATSPTVSPNINVPTTGSLFKK
jgi:hypothetical protein